MADHSPTPWDDTVPAPSVCAGVHLTDNDWEYAKLCVNAVALVGGDAGIVTEMASFIRHLNSGWNGLIRVPRIIREAAAKYVQRIDAAGAGADKGEKDGN